jgi:hypothetical protein
MVRRETVRVLRECPHLRIEMWAPGLWLNLGVGDPPRLRGLVQALVPPSTVRLAPVMYEDSGPATNDTRAATSSTVP